MADIKNEPEQLEAPDDPANEQPLVSHLIELRNRIVKAAISILIVFACMSPFMKQIFDYLSRPLMVALPQGVKLLATGVVAPFMVPLKVTLLRPLWWLCLMCSISSGPILRLRFTAGKSAWRCR